MTRVRIVQLANFYGPRSGGLRTALHHLGEGYVAHGHTVTLVVPGPRRGIELLPSGVQRITFPAPRIPGTGGYRLLDPFRVERLLADLGPDHIEVSDRFTLRGLGQWAARHGVSSSVISHERVDRLLEQLRLPPALARRAADRLDARLAAEFGVVVCSTAFAQAESIGSGPRCRRAVRRRPRHLQPPAPGPPPTARAGAGRRAADGALRPALAGETSPPQHRDRRGAARGRDAGPPGRRRRRADATALERRARHLPVTFVGFLGRRTDVARLLASADVAIAPGPHETFSAWPRSKRSPAARRSWRPGRRPWPRSSSRVVAAR